MPHLRQRVALMANVWHTCEVWDRGLGRLDILVSMNALLVMSHICVKLLAILNDIAACCQSATRKEHLKKCVAVAGEVQLCGLKNLRMQL